MADEKEVQQVPKAQPEPKAPARDDIPKTKDGPEPNTPAKSDEAKDLEKDPKASGDKSEKDTPVKDNTTTEKSKKDKSEKDTPVKDKPEKDKSEKDTPVKDNTTTEKSKKDKPEKDKAEKDKSEKDKPEKDKSEKDKPEKDKSEKDKAVTVTPPPRRFSRDGSSGGRGRRRRNQEPPPVMRPAPPEPEKYEFDFEFPPLFGKWDWNDIEIHDISLKSYLNLDPIIVPHIGGKYANRPFSNRKVNIVERLINNMMRTEHTTGNKSKTYSIVREAFDIIHKKTKRNPIQVFIESLEGAAPKEEITRLKYGGISVPKAVDIAASRRLDVALRNICKGTHQSSRKNKKKMAACLADELLRAARGDLQSFAIAKKDEVERIAASAR